MDRQVEFGVESKELSGYIKESVEFGPYLPETIMGCGGVSKPDIPSTSPKPYTLNRAQKRLESLNSLKAVDLLCPVLRV